MIRSAKPPKISLDIYSFFDNTNDDAKLDVSGAVFYFGW